MFYCYIIFSSKINRFYVGHTTNLEKRVTEHNSGISAFTAKANDWKLMHYEQFATREDAKNRETQIKKKKSRKYIEWMIANKSN